MCVYLVIAVVRSKGLGEPKVTDFGKVLVDQQDVPSCQVPVHKVLLLQVLHPHGHLVHQVHDVLHSYSFPERTKK